MLLNRRSTLVIALAGLSASSLAWEKSFRGSGSKCVTTRITLLGRTYLNL
jgi:hypothetical protein